MEREVAKLVYTKIKELIESSAFTEACRIKPNVLVRHRKITVPELVSTILRGAKQGLHTALLEMIESDEVKAKSYSEAAFCKARRKVNYAAFRTLSEQVAQIFYESAAEAEKIGGVYRVWAIDGSRINLPTTPETLEEFGSENFNHGPCAQGLASCIYDVLNKMILDSTLEPFDASERNIAENHFDVLEKFCQKQGWNPKEQLITLDRGYPSEDIFKLLLDKGFSFVVRTNKNQFWREVRDITKDDTVITRGSITVRVVQVPLKEPEVTKGGEIVAKTTLITNLSADEMPKEAIAQLYRLRWNIETNYRFLKHRVELENFTGLSPLCIRQDFYAAMYLSNLVACHQYDAAEQIEEYNQDKELDYKPNFTELYRQLRRDFYTLILSDSPTDRDRALKRIIREIMSTLNPIRPNRNPKRGKPAKAPKYHRNHKPT